MPSITNLSVAVTVPAGQVLTYNGRGVASLGAAAITIALDGAGTLGPFPASQAINLTGTLIYNVASVGGAAICIARRNCDAIASPIATVAGNGTLAQIPIVPGTIPDNSRLCITAKCKRTGANATALFEAYLGTSGSTSDALLASLTMNANSNHVMWMLSEGLFGTLQNSFISTGSATVNNSAAGASVIERTANVDRQQLMYLTLVMSSANAGDSFALMGYSLKSEP